VQAVRDFQANCGLMADGVCGPGTVRTLRLVSSQSGHGPGVTALREIERLRTGFEAMDDCRVVVGHFGGLSALVRSVVLELRQRRANVMVLDEPDAVAQALAANHFGAHVFLGLESVAESQAVATFYQVPSFESAGGRALADALTERLSGLSGLQPSARGMRLPVLRETRMPAVLLTLGPPRLATDAAPALVQAISDALEQWILRAP